MIRGPGSKPAKEEGSMQLFLGCNLTSSKLMMMGVEGGGQQCWHHLEKAILFCLAPLSTIILCCDCHCRQDCTPPPPRGMLMQSCTSVNSTGGLLHRANDPASGRLPRCQAPPLAFPMRKLAELDVEDPNDNESTPPSPTPM